MVIQLYELLWGVYRYTADGHSVEERHKERRQMEQFTCHIYPSWPLGTQYASDSILGNKLWTIKQSGPFTGERSVSQSPGKDVQTV